MEILKEKHAVSEIKILWPRINSNMETIPEKVSKHQYRKKNYILKNERKCFKNLTDHWEPVQQYQGLKYLCK